MGIMRSRDKIIIGMSLTLAVGLLYVSGRQIDPINTQRKDMGLIINTPLDNAPPALAFATVAMGAFRGLVVDILWMRADKLKEDGQFFDAKQLAEWITVMQPRFASVWTFNAWNLAYNISVAIPASQPDQRWRWIKNGYELLRDKGIPQNPKSVDLYLELARIFQHKLGGVSDDAHRYYKLQLADAMGPLLKSEDNDLTGDDNAYFDALIQTPTQWSQLAADANVAPLIEALGKADENLAAGDAFASHYLSLRQDPQRFKAEAADIINRYRGNIALKRLDLFAKAYELRHTWKLEPALMKEVNLAYGPVDYADPNKHYPMDWRHPDSHAIYWAMKGLKVAKMDKTGDFTSIEVNTDRILGHSLQNLFRYGKLTILEGLAEQPDSTGEGPPPMTREVFLSPDLRFFTPYNKYLLAIMAKYGTDATRKESFENGHRNMLRNAVLSFYLAGLNTQATSILNELRTRYPLPEFNVPVDEYATKRFVEERESLSGTDVTEAVVALLMSAFERYAMADDEASTAREQLAQRIYNRYNLENEPTFRIDVPAIEQFKYLAFRQVMSSNAYPLFVRQNLMERIRRQRPDLYERLNHTDTVLQNAVKAAQQPQPQK
jgi:hypothetical protein